MLRSLPKLSLIFSSSRNPHYLASAQRFISQGRSAASRVKIVVASNVPIRSKSTSTISSAIASEVTAEDQIQSVNLLTSTDDNYGGVLVELDQLMDSTTFISILRASVSHWQQLGKKGAWIKLPIHLVSLVEALVKEGFWYHHAEPKYLMLVYWIPESPSTVRSNATHRVLVVQENSGLFQGTGVWKFPTGVVDKGEDICIAAVREVKEETGVDSEFVEVLAFSLEILNAQWMPFEEYSTQPFVQESELLKYINDTCLAKMVDNILDFVLYLRHPTFLTRRIICT